METACVIVGFPCESINIFIGNYEMSGIAISYNGSQEMVEDQQ